LFDQFTEGFTSSASNPGVQLQWIGVGTWKMPSKITDEIITGKHLEAWRISWENLGRGNEKALKSLRQESQLQQTLRLIQEIPLARFNENAGKIHRDTVHDLLLGYREQLIEISELLDKSRRAVPPSLGRAIKHIETILGIKHWVGVAGSPPAADSPGPSYGARPKSQGTETNTGVPSTPPVSPDEEGLYEYLLQITGHDRDRAERLIEQERKKAPHAARMDLIQRAIDRLQ